MRKIGKVFLKNGKEELEKDIILYRNKIIIDLEFVKPLIPVEQFFNELIFEIARKIKSNRCKKVLIENSKLVVFPENGFLRERRKIKINNGLFSLKILLWGGKSAFPKNCIFS